jgi:hypothetical protein
MDTCWLNKITLKKSKAQNFRYDLEPKTKPQIVREKDYNVKRRNRVVRLKQLGLE